MSGAVTRPRAAWRVVAAREVRTQLRSKAFLLTGAALVLSLLAMVVVLTVASGHDRTQQVGVVDDTGRHAVEAGAEVARTVDEHLRLRDRDYDDAAAAEQAVRDGDLDAALLPRSDGSGYDVVGDKEVDDVVRQSLTAGLSGVVTARNADRQGVDLDRLAQGARVGERLLDADAEDAGLRKVASFVFVLLFYITALTFGMAMAASVTQEKESRVVEILAAAVPIRSLLWGKIAGNTTLAIGQTLVLALTGVVGLLVAGQGHALTVLGPAIAWYVVFFVLGFVTLAALWSVAGSLAGRQQDLQGTTAPLQIVLFAPYIIGATAGAGVKTVVSMLPVVSTMLMPARLAEGDVPVWQLVVALGATVLAAVVFVRVGSRVYERTLLRTGRRIGLREGLSTSADDA